MTYEQLCKNIAKSNYKSSNYYRDVKQRAYEDMQKFNNYVKELQRIKRDYTASDPSKQTYWIKVYSPKSKKMVWLTKYTTLPRFRTYRQQLAITNRQYFKALQVDLELRDYNRQHEYYYAIGRIPTIKTTEDEDEYENIFTDIFEDLDLD